MLLMAGPAAAQAPRARPKPPPVVSLPGTPQIRFDTPAALTVPMTTTWTPATGAKSYMVNGAYNDDTAYFSAVGVLSPLTRAMPYHQSGAATPGWTCVTVTGATEASCTGFTSPARPSTISTTHAITFQEPATNADGTPLRDLASNRVYYLVDSGPEQAVVVPASNPAGGQMRTVVLTVPFNTGILTVTATSIDTQGQESARSTAASQPLSSATRRR
jgi:hypothetical protein